MAWIVAYIDQGNAATIAITPNQATNVAAGGTKVISATQIWANEDLAATSVLTRQTDAANFTTSAAVKLKMVVFQINPDALDIAGGFDCITLIFGSSNAGNITSAFLLVEPRYDSNTNMIVD
ncbi:MAG: hypothetical protein IMY86_13990 [Chloroflexi bacterium]|nr:hypothetical protein [Chloroflexota bacterium]